MASERHTSSNSVSSVGIWLRVSTEDQARGESPEVHEKRARMYAEARGWKVREVYRLDAVSEKAVIEHSEAQRMLADIKSGHITALIFSKIARLARNTRELLEFADAFRDANADMVSLAEAIDTGSAAGRLIEAAQAELKKIEAEDDRLYQAYIADELSKEDFGRRHRPLSERRDQLEAELPRLQAELDVLRISSMAETVALTDASDLAQRWDQFSQPEKRQLVEIITDAITIAKEEVTIDLLYLPGGGGNATRPRGCVAF